MFNSSGSIVEYLGTPTVDQATITKINFFPKGHSKSALNFLLINIWKSFQELVFTIVCNFTVICFKSHWIGIKLKLQKLFQPIICLYVMQIRSKLSFFPWNEAKNARLQNAVSNETKKSKKLSWHYSFLTSTLKNTRRILNSVLLWNCFEQLQWISNCFAQIFLQCLFDAYDE